MPPEMFIILTGFGCLFIAAPCMLFLKWQAKRNSKAGATQAAPAIVQQKQNVVIDTPVVSLQTMPIVNVAPETRQHTIVAAKPGDGKTTTGNAMMVADIQRGATVIVLNPHFTYYHPSDQRIDLRPLRACMRVVYEYAEIAAQLRSLLEMVNDRLVLYRNGEHTGENICVYVDEWPAIAGDETYGKECAKLLSQIIRQARKCNIWIVLLTQDALVETLQLSGGIRANFATRLVGNVDATTWRELLGKDVPRQMVEKGTWFAAIANWTGVATTTIPDDKTIVAIARQCQANAPQQLQKVATGIATTLHQEDCNNSPADDILDRVVDYLQDNPNASQREVEKALFNYTGGEAYAQVSKVIGVARQLATTTT